MTSIELPEARILAEQMQQELQGKRVQSYRLQDIERLQKIGLMDKDTGSFEGLIGGRIQSVVSRGNAIRVKLNTEMNLILAPEYGGMILYHEVGEEIPTKFHLRVGFSDGTALTVRLTSIGLISALRDRELERSYIYRRDFNPEVPSPMDEEFTFDRFSSLIKDENRMLKSVLVGKHAVIVGVSNSAFQDILYRARVHPKRKAVQLSGEERRALFKSIGLVLQERVRLKGKEQFLDLYGSQGEYTPAMGPRMRGQSCPACGTPIDKLSVGGGYVFFCPSCQK